MTYTICNKNIKKKKTIIIFVVVNNFKQNIAIKQFAYKAKLRKTFGRLAALCISSLRS